MKTVTYNDIVGGYYQTAQPCKGLIVVALGAPSIANIDSLKNQDLLLEAGYDIIVPDYYGFCRSWKKFLPMNSIATLLVTKEVFAGGTVTDVYTQETLRVAYDTIIFLWLSYGASVVAMLPKFDDTVTTMGLFYPLFDYTSLWTMGVKEETTEDFLAALKLGFGPLYRGIDDPLWTEQFNDNLWLTPSKHTELMEGKNVFLAHGTEDESIYYKKTEIYADAIKEKAKIVACKIYPGLKHGSDTLLPATKDFIQRLEMI